MPNSQDLPMLPLGPPGPPLDGYVQKIEPLSPTLPVPPQHLVQDALAPHGDGQGGAAPRWGTMIPLIGGSALGCERATGVRPLFHLSYSPFAANESHLMNAWPEVPR